MIRSAMSWAGLAAALALLDFALTFDNVWPTLWIVPRASLSIEIALLVLGLAAAGAIGRGPSRRVVTVLAAVLCAMAVGRYAEVTTAALYGRPIHLYFDAPHVPHVAAMLAKVAAPWQLGAGFAVAAVLVAAVFLGLRRAIGRVAAAASAPEERRVLFVSAAAVAALYALVRAGLPLPDPFSSPVTGTWARQVRLFADAMAADREGRLLPPPVDFGDGPLPAVRGADVVVAFVESYGAVGFDRPDIAAAVTDARRRLADAVAGTGRQAVSAFVESPTFAGASWLAHASFLSGLRVDNGGAYETLLARGGDTFAARLERSGYRTVAVMPGLRESWPEGDAFGFDTIADAEALDWRGPEFGWWRIPDQYVLGKLDDLGVGDGRGPASFVLLATISTHVPFRPTPPYQPDWSRLETGRPYDEAPLGASLAARPEWLNLGPAYADSLRYAYDVWAGFLAEHAGDDLVLILLGDHQPAASVAGRGARRDVPMHVITSRPAILASLRDAGFTPGLEPRGSAIAEMHRIPELLLDAFAAEASVAAPRKPPPAPDLPPAYAPGGP
ncbi:MAG TPA: sulfatase-like hydrolase/transferase [Gammaproteobacteria bacterium]